MGIKPDTPTRVKSVSIADALFSRVQQRVLAVLYGNPSRSFFASEIIRLAGSGSGAVQRELARLEAAGLVTVDQLGRQRHYRANSAAPVFEELRGIVLKTFGLVDRLRLELAPRARDIRAAFIFGSVAKREDSASSDIDLLVVSDDLAYADLFALLEPVSTHVGRVVNPTLFTTTELESRLRSNNAFLTRILQQPKLWVIGGEDVFSAR
jgi:predicted nucleotidyltransferase